MLQDSNEIPCILGLKVWSRDSRIRESASKNDDFRGFRYSPFSINQLFITLMPLFNAVVVYVISVSLNDLKMKTSSAYIYRLDVVGKVGNENIEK